ncbi:hypothetical protein D3C76_973690 [compost metagenome]
MTPERLTSAPDYSNFYVDMASNVFYQARTSRPAHIHENLCLPLSCEQGFDLVHISMGKYPTREMIPEELIQTSTADDQEESRLYHHRLQMNEADVYPQ